MAITTELQRIIDAKADIKASIEAKGVSIPSNATIDDYSQYVDAISGGDGVDWKAMFTGLVDGSLSGDVTIPDGVKQVAASYKFQNCGMTSVVLPESCASLGNYAFDNNGSLAAISMPSVAKVANGIFRNCSSLATVTFPVCCYSIGTNALQGCSGLQSVKVEAVSPPTDGTPASCFGDTNYTFPIYVPSIAVDIYKAAFPNYASRMVADPDEVDPYATAVKVYFTTTEANTQISCMAPGSQTSKTVVSLDGAPAVRGSVPTTVPTAGDHVLYFFPQYGGSGSAWLLYGSYSCRVVIDGVSSTKKIDIPSFVNYIGEHTFRNIASLETINCYATTPPSITRLTFFNTFATLHVPHGSKAAYAADEFWLAVASNDTDNIIEDL